jgi:hypothetical protein
MSDILREAAKIFRDVILNERGLISENGMTSDQINDVLNEFDKAFGAALAQPKAQEPTVEKLAQVMHYPECWDTAAYPTIESALHEAYSWAKCNVCQPKAQEPTRFDSGSATQWKAQEPYAWAQHFKDSTGFVTTRLFFFSDMDPAKQHWTEGVSWEYLYKVQPKAQDGCLHTSYSFNPQTQTGKCHGCNATIGTGLVSDEPSQKEKP